MATMVQRPTERELRHRNAKILGAHGEMLITHPERLTEIPNGASLEFLPEDDLFLAGYNYARARQWADNGRNVYLVYVDKHGAFSAPVPLDS
jgi:hypothetical protein